MLFMYPVVLRTSYTAVCLQSIGQSLPLDSNDVPLLEVAVIAEALRQHLQGTYMYFALS